MKKMIFEKNIFCPPAGKTISRLWSRVPLNFRHPLLIASFIILGLGVVAHAMVSFSDIVKWTPSSISVTPQASLLDEVKTLEASTVGLAFDRDTTTSYTAYGTSQVRLAYDASAQVSRFKVFGPAPYLVSVAVDNGGSSTPIASWQNLDLSNIPSGTWSEWNLSTAVSAQALVLTLTPKTGGSSTAIQEMEFWGQGLVWNMNGTAWVTALQGGSGQGNQLGGREYDAKPALGSIGTVNGQTTTSQDFLVNVDRDGADFKRAFLVYDVNGLSQWIAPLRAVNGETDMGGWPLPGSNTWTTQVEAIDPHLLTQGANHVRFDLPPSVSTGYQVRNLRLIGELDTGANLIASIDVPTGDGNLMLDGDETTGWSPWLKYNGGANPVMTLNLDRPCQIDDLKVYVKNTFSGQIKASAHTPGGGWSVLGSAVQGGTLGSGWQDLRVKTSAMVDQVQLTFQNGSGSTGSFQEVVAFGSGSGKPFAPTVTVSYPNAGQFYGRLAYIRGFLGALDNGSGPAQVMVGPKSVTLNGNAFETVISKDDVGLSAQADGDPWSVDITVLYPDNTQVVKKVTLDNGLGAVSGSSGQSSSSSTYGTTLKPGQGKSVSISGAQLIVDPTALSNAINLQALALKQFDLPALDSGMVNVTAGPYRGYRFLPHGTHFNHAVTLAVPYDPELIPGGSTEEDIKTYFFDKEQGRWVPLALAQLDKVNHKVLSLTDHFTDFINATVTVPDHPQETSFNPTQLKDIKAADPGAGINLIEPPSANNQGTANLSYPIEVPPGRHGIQPQLAVQYNSGGGDSWMGVGWDLPIQSISVETRWGVPRYQSGAESETYLLNGEMLVEETSNGPYLAHRAASFLSPRVTPVAISGGDLGVTFHTRTEGQFRRILRHGSDPTNYWWEVDDKNGNQMFFGAARGAGGPLTGNGDAAVLTTNVNGNNQNIFLWALREMRDQNGNTMFYHYKVNSATFSSNGTGHEIYQDSVSYTGTGDMDNGQYSVSFFHGKGLYTDSGNTPVQRPDVMVNAKGGFPRVSQELLDHIDISRGTTFIRGYQFTYSHGAFNKTLLAQVTQSGADHSVFNTHTFDYFNGDGTHTLVNSDGSYNGFTNKTWTVSQNVNPNNLVDTLGIPVDHDASAINATKGFSGGGHFYVGFAPEAFGKDLSLGAKFGSSSAENDGVMQMTDMNGDGLPDQVYVRADGQIMYRPNSSGPGEGTSFGAPLSVTNLNVSVLSKDNSSMTGGGGELYLGFPGGGAGGLFNISGGFDQQSMYFMDVNGDGVPDFVNNGTVYFGRRVLNGSVESIDFNTTSGGTPNPLNAGNLNTSGLLPPMDSAFALAAKNDPLVDTVRRWTAPFNGTVSILAPVTLFAGPATYTQNDGVRVAIEGDFGSNPATVLGSQFIPVSMAGTSVPIPVGPINVQKGDRIYFRVQSVYDGAFDRVQWDPIIRYTNFTPVTDFNNLDPTRYQGSRDFVLAGRPAIFAQTSFNGRVVFHGDFNKTGITTDSVKVLIIKNPSLPGVSTNGSPQTLLSQSLAATATGTVPIDGLVGGSTLGASVTLTVAKNDIYQFRVASDSNIDLTQMSWAPNMYYVDLSGNSPNIPVSQFFDTNTGAPLYPVNAPTDSDFYPRNDLTVPQTFFTVPQPSFTPSPVPTLTSNQRAALFLEGSMGLTTTAPLTLQVLVNNQVTYQQSIPATTISSFPVSALVAAAAVPTPASILIQEFSPNTGGSGSTAAQYVVLRNTTNAAINLTGYRIGNDLTKTASSGPTADYSFPSATIPARGAVIVAVDGTAFQTQFGCPADFAVTNLSGASALTKVSGGSITLSSSGDQLVLWDTGFNPVDSVAYGGGDYSGAGLFTGSGNTIPAPGSGKAWRRTSPGFDTNSMGLDFVQVTEAPCATKSAVLGPFFVGPSDSIRVKLITTTQTELNHISWNPQISWKVLDPVPTASITTATPTFFPAYEIDLTAPGITRVRNLDFNESIASTGVGPVTFPVGFVLSAGQPPSFNNTAVTLLPMVFTAKETLTLDKKVSMPVTMAVSDAITFVSLGPLLWQEQHISSFSVAFPSLKDSLEVTEGDRLYFNFTIDMNQVPHLLLLGGVFPVPLQDLIFNNLHNAILKGTYGHLNSPSTGTAIEDFSPLPKATDSTLAIDNSFFAMPYRGWAFAAAKENRSGPITDVASASSPTGPLNESDFIMPNFAAMDQSAVTQAAATMKGVFMYPDPPNNQWVAQKNDVFVQASQMESSRLGNDQLNVPTLGQVTQGNANVPGSGAFGPPRISQNDQDAEGISAGFSIGGGINLNANGSHSGGDSYGILDFMDMNGDGYPDIVRHDGVQYTLPKGGLNEFVGQSFSHKIRITSNDAFGGGVAGGLNPNGSGSSAVSQQTNGQSNSTMQGNPGNYTDDFKGHSDSTAHGQSTGADSGHCQMQELGASGNIDSGQSNAVTEMIDMNGDGLPDRARVDGSGQLQVQLNTGYGFASESNWTPSQSVSINHGEAFTTSVGANGGFGGQLGANDKYGFAGGVNATISLSNCQFTLADINGDGLPDILLTNGSNVKVYFNTGSGFSGPVAWTGAVDSVARSRNLGVGGGLYFTINIYIPFAGSIIINPGGDKGNSVARQEVMLMDMNGDGYPDQLETTNQNNLTVHENNTAKTNLLKTVHRPLGATIDMDYTREGNTYSNPHNRWNLTKLTVFDGGQNKNAASNPSKPANGADYQLTTYAYDTGVDGGGAAINAYDRFERDFLGYKSVTETQFNTNGLDASQLGTAGAYRRIAREYLNFNIYEKGLLLKETADDVQGGGNKPFLETDNTYILQDADASAVTVALGDPSILHSTQVVFPQLVRTDKHFFEGNPQPGPDVSTFQKFTYDTIGNVTGYFDAGEPSDPSSAVTAVITYVGGTGSVNSLSCSNNAYLAGLADSIHVFKGNGVTELRHRESTVDCKGNVTQVRQYLGTSDVATTDMVYDGNGSVTQVLGPNNENQVGGGPGTRYELDYVYESQVQTYPVTIIDSFGYRSGAHYDLRFGKMDNQVDENSQAVTTVYDEFGRATSITGPFEANAHHNTIIFDYHPEAAVPFAYTQHFDVQHPNDTIDTLLFTDGLKRVIQTKKDTAVRVGTAPQDKMTASGRVVFDHVGRTIQQFYPTMEDKDTAAATITASTNAIFHADSYDADAIPTTVVYDILDRNIRTTIPDGTSISVGYDIAGTKFKTTVIDALTNKKETFRDVRELITQVNEFNHDKNNHPLPTHTTTYAYDALKQIIQVVEDAPGRAITTTVDYDNFGRRTSIDNPDTGKTAIVYDLASNVLSKQTANLRAESRSVSYFYNFGRLEQIKYPNFQGNNVTYVYGTASESGAGFGNVAARIKQVTDEAGTQTRAYDALGNIVSETRTLKLPQGSPMQSTYRTTFVYDTWNRMQSMVYADGEVLTYHYDSGGNADAVTGKVGGAIFPYVTSVQYDKFEQRVLVQNGNGTSSTYDYKPDNRRLLQLVHNSSVDGNIADLNYTYDAVGNITDLKNGGVVAQRNIGGAVTQHFEYDGLYHLTDASGNFRSLDATVGDNFESRYTLAMNYDVLNNIITKDQKVIGKRAGGKDVREEGKPTYKFDYTYDSVHPHAPKAIGGRTYTYDANGNQLGFTQSGGPDRNIVWDEENRIQAIKDGGGDPQKSGLNFAYDDSGQRILKEKGGDVTAYINQFFTVRQPHNSAGAAMSKHVFIGNTRVLSQVEHGAASSGGGGGGNNGSGGGSGSGGSGDGSGDTATVLAASATIYQGATPNSPPEGTAATGTVLQLLGTQNHGGTMDKVLFDGMIGFVQVGDVTASGTGGSGGGKGNNKGSGGNSGGTSTSVLPQVQDDHFVFYYHTDHLGSTGYVTDREGKLSENVQYFPFGETWVEQRRGMSPFPDYLFTGKELDTETGLYYFGARYYDPRTSVWQSADVAYLQELTTDTNEFHKSSRLALYSYSSLNPLVFLDPDGNKDIWISTGPQNRSVDMPDDDIKKGKVPNMLTNNPTNQIYHKDEHDVVGLYKTPSHTYPIFKSPKAGWDSATAEMKKLGSLPLVLVLAKHTVGNSGVKYSAVDILKNFGKPGYTYKDLAEHFKTPLTIIKNKFGLASVDISIDRMDKLPGFDPRKMAEAFAQNEGYFAYGNPKVTTDPKKSWGASSNDPRVHSLPAEKIHIDNP